MRVKDLVKGEKYFSKTHKVTMIYCGVEKFRGHRYYNFFDPSWRLFHWLDPKEVRLPKKPSK